MNTTIGIKNWATGENKEVLEEIHQEEVNIAIYERDISSLQSEIERLIKLNVELRIQGDLKSIINSLKECINYKDFGHLIDDIKELINLFGNVSGASKFKVYLATVNTNMCRRFHTDINDIRLLCTYSGQGTLWLTEDNVQRDALSSKDDNDSICIDETMVRQAKTGDVLVLKGAIYPKIGTKAIVHRSPTIEETGDKRLLLRIDNIGFLNF